MFVAFSFARKVLGFLFCVLGDEVAVSAISHLVQKLMECARNAENENFNAMSTIATLSWNCVGADHFSIPRTSRFQWEQC